MCYQDLVIGRHVRSGQATVSVDTTGSRIVSSSPDRTHLLIGSPASGTVTLSLSPSPTAGEGIVLTAGMQPLILSVQRDGDLPMREWFAVATAGTVTFATIEGFLSLRRKEVEDAQ